MKGIVFVEFLEMLDGLIGLEATEDIVSKSDLPSKGYYTSVGTYDDQEMLSLVSNLHEKTQIPIPDLLKTFGKYLFKSFTQKYAGMLGEMEDAFDLLKKIDNHIHVEVQKLYPTANLPKFDYQEISDKELLLIYKSERKMPDLAEGLIEATLEHYNESATITRHIKNEDNSWVEFLISKK